ncbi:MAG TPA: pitrilysin family protein [Sandaracinaceae bacterium]
MKRALTLSIAAALAASSCAGPSAADRGAGTSGGETTVEVVREHPRREEPPPSGPARDIQFPPIARTQTSSGLELNTVEFGGLPLVYLRLVVKSGSASDPADLPGLAQMVAEMLKEGTRSRTSAQLAEDVEFLGADLSVGADAENLYIMISALSEHLDQAMEILADVARNPRFAEAELRRLKRRELDRLALSSQEPRYLARRELYRELYGSHPYAHIDATPESVRRISRRDLSAWHRAHVVPNNAFLVAVGDVQPARVQAAAERAFRGWRARPVPEERYPAPPERTAREVLVVDRPESLQSVIYVGNLALARNDPDFVPLQVANQVLGGSAASRLFMDLRERRSLTYGAYSSIQELAQVAPFTAFASVRNDVTAEAMAGFMEHLERIVAEPPSQDELTDAQRYLSDSFPLDIETAGRIARMVESLRIFGLPDDYWDTYRTSIREVTAEQAHAAAREHIRPDRALIVAVGRAAAIAEPLRRFGPVRVIDVNGEEIVRLPAVGAGGAASAQASATQE